MKKYTYKQRASAVLVLGSHRSGTSVLTRALASAGVCLGNDLYGPRYDNPKGFFEDKIANQLDDEFIGSFGGWWGSLMHPSLVSQCLVATYQNALKEKVFKRFKEDALWGLKDPRISRLWRFWLPVFTETGVTPIFLLANRHPFSVASSLANRDRMPKAQALVLWILHQLDALEALVEFGGLVVDYDLMLSLPNRELQRIALYLGTTEKLTQDAIALFEGDFVDPKLRHTHCRNEPVKSSLEELSIKLYEGLLDLAKLPSGLDEKNIARAHDLITMCRSELAMLEDWMEAIDALNQSRFSAQAYNAIAESRITDPQGFSISFSLGLESVVNLLKCRIEQSDKTIQDLSSRIFSMNDELLRAEAQIELLKDIMLDRGKDSI